ncbi:MAG TPA: efflux RND transporter periplasmic adaptor subunit [Pirellulales bacterium]|nr:efflux RND transporter periplasmic adaptor subunit [Pirellulales bacterium]
MPQQTTTRQRLSAASAPADAPPNAPPHAARVASRPGWLPNAVSTGLVVAALGGIAYWGHRADWTVPKFSALVGGGPVDAEAWCKEHNVAESECIECDASLLPPENDYGWCKEHGIAQCSLHHPDVAQLKDIPSVSPELSDRATRALALLPRPENNSRCKLHRKRIQFASAEAADKAGVDIDVAQERPVVEAIAASGEVIYDETRMAHLASRAAGTAWSVASQLGDQVGKGDVLALIDAAEVGRAKGELVQAVAQWRLKKTNVDRMKPLAADQTVSGRQFREAQAALDEATVRLLSAQHALVNLGLPVRAAELADLDIDEISERLQFLGIPAEIVAALDVDATTSNLLPLKSPLDGVVVERNLAPGEVIDTKTPLFSVADLRRMWLMLAVRQEDAKYLALGQTVLFRPSGGTDEKEITGSLSWISTSVDEPTRTVNVRVDLPNSSGLLRANTFGAGRIVLREEPRAVVVPSEAVHWDGCCHVVFVRDKHYLEPDAPKFFHIRQVRPGVKQDDGTELIAGLLPGEVVAAKNSVVLEAQLLKSNLGAGCCEACAPKK